jgi:hypothetical protein
VAGAGVTGVGLSLLVFGIAAVDVMREEGAGGVTQVLAGAGLAVIGLLFTNWTWPWGRPSRRQPSQDQEELFEMEGAEVRHASTESGSAAGGASNTPGGQAPGPAAQPGDRQGSPPADGPTPAPGVEARSQAPLTDPDTPDDVRIRTQARIPEIDPTLGINVNPPNESSSPEHRLVVLGDSLSQGFQSLAMFNTDLSYPAMIARELGCYESFRHPEYLAFGGLPLNLEYLAREMERRDGGGVTWWEQGSAVSDLDHLLEKIRHYWQDGPGCVVPSTGGIMHNLAIPGCDIRDLMTMTADTAKDRLAQAENARFRDRAGNAGLLLALRILASARDPETKRALTAVEAATVLGKQGGIETLIVFIGVYNAIGPMLDLQVRWSDDGHDDPTQKRKRRYNMWRPTHFEAELDKLVEQVCSVEARHVIWATVPHVTILPIARGVGGKMRQGSRYFAYYTRPWISDAEFDADPYPRLTGQEARAIDSAIDQYNDAIADNVRAARKDGKDWLLLDVAGLFDRLAARRYGLDQAARPPWWEPYQPLVEIVKETPAPDSQFFAASPEGRRIQGGLFSLDGVHPTTIGYAILAQEFINVMADAGVVFADAQGKRRERPAIDLSCMVARDTLISDPPRSIKQDVRALGWADERLNWVAQLGRLL